MVKLTNTLLFLDDVQLLGLQGVQGAGGVGIQGVKSTKTTCTETREGWSIGAPVNQHSIIFRWRPVAGSAGCPGCRRGGKLTNTLLFLDDVQLLGLQGVQGAGGVGIQGVKLTNTLLFLDDVQLLGLQGVQGAVGMGIQGVK